MYGIKEQPDYWPKGHDGPFNPNHAKRGDAIRPIFSKDGKIMHGLPHENKLANKHLKDQVYHINLLNIGDFVSYVSLQEIHGMRFNSVHFKFDTSEVPERDRDYPCGVCDEGNYVHSETGPGYMRYKCDRCDHTVTFP